MLSNSKTYAALTHKQAAWQAAHALAAHNLGLVRRAVEQLSAMSVGALVARLEDLPWSGARPTAEHDRYPGQAVPFGRRFASHEEARAWAATVIRGQPTFAADGSQITPLPEFSLPIGAAQVAWYYNPHDPNLPHEKDLSIEVLLGDDLSGGAAPAATRIQTRRFQMEVDAINGFIARTTGASPAPTCFYDGPLVVSFATPRAAQRREDYVPAISGLLDAAEAARFPLVGYIAASGARDVVDMLRVAGLLPDGVDTHDASLMRGLLPHWGDRSVVYLCARDDGVLRTYPGHDQAPPDYRIAFCYLNVAADAPARLEFPAWLTRDETELARVLDIVRAECIIGLGYPYAIEAADQAAYIGGPERETFKRLVSTFAEQHSLELSTTPKARSKQRRRHGG